MMCVIIHTMKTNVNIKLWYEKSLEQWTSIKDQYTPLYTLFYHESTITIEWVHNIVLAVL